MSKKIVTTVVCWIMISVLASVGVQANGPEPLMWIPCELVLGLDPGTNADTINGKFGTSEVRHLEQLNIYLLNAANGANLDSLAELMETEPGVQFCHPNYIIDPLEPVQGSIPFGDAIGEGEYAEQGAAQSLGLSLAHGLATGDGVVVAVIDGGVNASHPAFEGTVVSGWDYIDDDPYAHDEPGGANSGHGTFVAGLVHLVAPNVEIRSYRVTDLEGESNGYVVADAIMRAVDEGCRVINLSMVTMASHEAMIQAIQYAKDHDVLTVVAAGNGQDDQAHYPASDPNSMAVAAVDSTFLLADFSNFGEYVDVCAPGTRLYAPYHDTSYAWWGGTSFSTPFVTALAALLASFDSELTCAEIRGTILATATSLDSLNPGHEGQLGAGLIDPIAAILAIRGEALTLRVPSAYPTIQDAINASYHGDTILVAPGTYYGGVNFSSKSVILLSEEGPEATILRPLVNSNVALVNLRGTYLPGVEFNGFTVTGAEGYTYTGIVDVDGSSPLITNCIFHSNNLDDWDSDRRVLRIESGMPVVSRCLFYNNGGHSLYLYWDFVGTRIINNTFDGGFIGAYANSYDNITFYNNIVTNFGSNGIRMSGSKVDEDYCDSWGNNPNYRYYIDAGPNDIQEDPQYLAPELGHYQLQPGSPCVDAGHPDPEYNDPDGSRCDMGAFPLSTEGFPLVLGVAVSPGDGMSVASLTPVFHWTPLALPPASQNAWFIQIGTDADWNVIEMWDDAMSTTDTTAAYAGSPLSDLTLYYGRMRIADGTSSGAWYEFQFQTSAGGVIEVPGDRPTLAEAVELATDGDTIILAPGDYTETITIANKGVNITSSGGAEVTTITAASSTQAAITYIGGGNADSPCSVSDVTIAGGKYGVRAYDCGELSVSYCTITGAAIYGVAAYDSVSLEVSNCILTGNGGGVEAKDGALTVTDCLVHLNDAGSGVNGILFGWDLLQTTITGNIIARNTDDYSVNVVNGGDVILEGNTLYGNTVGGLRVSQDGGTIDIRNNLIAWNTGTPGISLSAQDSLTVSIEYNNAYGNSPSDYAVVTGVGCLSVDPLFVDTTGMDFVMLPGSPCLDAGDPNPAYNDPDGSRCDIGAVMGQRVYPGPAGITISPLDTAGWVTSLNPEISWSFADTAATSQQQYQIQIGSDDQWDVAEQWDSGPVYASDTSVVYAGTPLNPIGKYFIRIRLHNGLDWGGWAFSLMTTKMGTLVQVPEHFESIQYAIDVAAHGDTVLVGPGTYVEHLSMKGKAILFTSSDGPESTFLEAPAGIRYCMVAQSGEASSTVITGFTFQNGDRTMLIDRASPTITGNRFINTVGGAVWISYSNGPMTISDNYFEGCGYYPVSTFYGGPVLIENNTVINSTVWAGFRLYRSDSPIIRYNTVVNNFLITYYEGGINLDNCDYAVVHNNTIAGNWAETTTMAGIKMTDCKYADVFSNIVCFNANMRGVHGYYGEGLVLEYNNVFTNELGDYDGLVPGLGSIVVDPEFVDTAAGDFSLLKTSPCIDAGRPGLAWNDPDGSQNDMGALPYAGPWNYPIAGSVGMVDELLSSVIGQVPVIIWTFRDSTGSPSGYHVEVGTDAEWSVAEMWSTGEVTSSDTSVAYAGSALVDGESYFLRIRLHNGSGWGDWRQVWFHCNMPPTGLMSISPVNGETVGTGSKLSVSAAVDPDSYELLYDFEVYSDPSLMGAPVVTLPPVLATSDTVSSGLLEGLMHDSTYYWRVRATDGFEFSEWTEVESFLFKYEVYLSRINGGSMEDGEVHCGRQVELIVGVVNTQDGPLSSIENAFQIYSPDGAAFGPTETSWEFSNVDWRNYFDLMLYDTAYYSEAVDTAIFAGIRISAGGMPQGIEADAFRIKAYIDCSEAGKTLCIDSVGVAMVDRWRWVVGASNPYEYISPSWDGPHCFTVVVCCFGNRGDINGDGTDADIADLIYMVDYMFQGGPDLPCAQEANVNGDPDESIDIADVIYLVFSMFGDGPTPYPCGVVEEPLAKVVGESPVLIATSYVNDTTMVTVQSSQPLHGFHLELGGTGPFSPTLLADRRLEMFYHAQDSTAVLGIFDIDGSTAIAPGTVQLVLVPGRFEVKQAWVADAGARTLVPRIDNSGAVLALPEEFRLSQNYPNPFNPSTRIGFALPVASHVRLEVINILGQRVVTLADREIEAGNHEILWDGTNTRGKMVSSGVYFYRLEAGSFTETRKMVLLK